MGRKNSLDTWWKKVTWITKKYGARTMEKVYSINYMLKLIKSFGDSRTNDFMFIKHYNTLSLPEDEVSKVIDESEYCFCIISILNIKC